MFATARSATLLGVDGHAVCVEVYVGKGLPGFTVVGSPDAVCREARDRVRAALLTSGLQWPGRRITVNLAPSGLRKGGSGLDLAMALAVAAADEQLSGPWLNDWSFIGELGLDGSVRAVPGTLSMVDAIGTRSVVVSHSAASEAELVGRHEVRSVATLSELIAAVEHGEPWPQRPQAPPPELEGEPPDLCEVRGQPVARHALEVAAAGGHHLLMYGPPGGGKTMLARRLAGLLPRLDPDDSVLATRIHSAAGAKLPAGGLIARPPFRAPHHGASSVAMIGGGASWLSPGEISLAHGRLRNCSMKHTADEQPTTAGIYCRISSDPNDTRLGVDRQREDCEALAERRGWPVAGVYVDNDTSAYSGKARPEYERLLSDIEAGRIDSVIIWHPDRLHRSPLELNQFIDLVERTGVTLATVQAGDYDLTTPSGRLSARIVGDVARHESEHKSERLRRKHLELAKAGKVSGGGTRPFGFEQDRRTVRDNEAELIREAVDRLLAGESLRGVTNDFERRGIKTVTGTAWKPTVLRRLVTSARIAGWREHKGDFVAEAEWPPIVEKSKVERLRAKLLDPSRRSNTRSRRYLLTGGLATCDLCEANLVARPKSDGRRCYVCASDSQFGGCGKIRILADDFEEAVAEMVFLALDDPSFTKALKDSERASGPDQSKLLDDIDGDEQRLEELALMFADGDVSKSNYLKAQERIQNRLDGFRRQLAELSGRNTLQALQGGTEQLRRDWKDMSVDAKRAIVSAALIRIPVGPAIKGQNFFNPARLGEPVWVV